MDQSVENGEYEADNSAIGHVDLAHVDDFVLGPLSVAPSRRLISGTLADATLEPKVMVVLVALARAGTRTLSKDDLIRQCWDGRIVGDASINRVISLLRTALRETTGDAVQVETIPKVGYRILTDADADEELVQSAHAETTASQRKFGSLALIGGLVLALLAAFAAYSFWPSTEQDRISIAMLPFEAHEGTDSFYVSGMASELQSELARHPDLEVTSPDSARQLLGQDRSIQQIGSALATDRVLKGSIEAELDRTVLHLELIDSQSGEIIWQDRLASALDSAETLPIRAVRELVRSIGLQPLASRDEARISDADYQLFLAARGMIASRQTEQLTSAMEIFGQIIERSPNFAGGLSGRAKAALFLTGRLGDSSLAELAREDAQRALELDPNSVEAMKVLGLIGTDTDQSVSYLKRAVELDPGDAEAWLWYGQVTDHPDHYSEMVHATKQLAKLDPLWDRVWQAPYYLRGAGQAQEADRIDNIIRAAAAEPWQAELATARIAKRRGDQSEFVRVAREAMQVASPRERQILSLQLTNQAQLLGVPVPVMPSSGIAGVANGAIIGRLPSEAEMNALGIDGQQFFSILPLVIGGASTLVADGRSEQLVRYFDEAFGSAEALKEFGFEQLRTHHFIPQLGTYIGFAMREVGREEEAQKLFALAEESVALWGNAQPNMTAKMFEANLAAAKGENARAVSAIEAAIGLGWPYNSQSPGVTVQGPLSRDLVWKSMQDDPALVRVLAPVRANIAKERAEVLALSN